MRLGIVSDIHCNIGGLDEALALMGDVDELLCLGDSVSEFRFSNEVIARLRERDARTIQGNHEHVLLGMHGAKAREAAHVDRDLLDWLGTRPEQLAMEAGGKRLLLVHSTPWMPSGEYVFPRSPSLQRFGEVDADIVLYGHTHTQLVRRVGRVLVINPGSAGDARDQSNGRQLSCAVLDTVTEEVRIIDFPLVRG